MGLILRAATFLAAALFLARGVGWREIVGIARTTGLVLPGLVVVLNAVMMGLRAMRLRILLGRRLSLAASYQARLTSSALNNITPFRGGDVARLWMIERASGVAKPAAAAVGVVESLAELAALAPLGFAASFLTRGQRWATAVTPLALCTAVSILLWLGKATARAAKSTGQTTPGRNMIRDLLSRLEPGFRPFAQARAAAATLLLSLLAWLCEGTMIVLCARAMGMPISFPLATVVLVGINFALMLPSTPASAGPFEGATVAVLMLAGFSKTPALAFALYYHAIQVIPVTVVGVAVLLVAKRCRTESAPVSSTGNSGAEKPQGYPAPPCRDWT